LSQGLDLLRLLGDDVVDVADHLERLLESLKLGVGRGRVELLWRVEHGSEFTLPADSRVDVVQRPTTANLSIAIVA